MSLENNLKNNLTPKKKRKLFSNFWYDFVKITGAIPALLWMRPKIYYPFGKPSKKGAMLISSNHPTWIDPIIVLLAFPWRRLDSLATKDLFSSKTKAFFFSKVRCIIVDKDNFSLSSFHEVVSRLKNGSAVVIFPEGRVNLDSKENLLAFKSGVILMAHKAQSPILPMYIVRRKKWYHRQRIVMGNLINVSDALGKMPTMQDMNRITELLREKEMELREYYESLPVYNKLNPTNTERAETKA